MSSCGSAWIAGPAVLHPRGGRDILHQKVEKSYPPRVRNWESPRVQGSFRVKFIHLEEIKCKTNQPSAHVRTFEKEEKTNPHYHFDQIGFLMFKSWAGKGDAGNVVCGSLKGGHPHLESQHASWAVCSSQINADFSMSAGEAAVDVPLTGKLSMWLSLRERMVMWHNFSPKRKVSAPTASPTWATGWKIQIPGLTSYLSSQILLGKPKSACNWVGSFHIKAWADSWPKGTCGLWGPDAGNL